jgi:hypothetical protein
MRSRSAAADATVGPGGCTDGVRVAPNRRVRVNLLHTRRHSGFSHKTRGRWRLHTERPVHGQHSDPAQMETIAARIRSAGTSWRSDARPTRSSRTKRNLPR